MRLYVYPSFDDQPTETICKIDGESNAECEKIAAKYFGDTDNYAWGYNAIGDSDSAPDYKDII